MSEARKAFIKNYFAIREAVGTEAVLDPSDSGAMLRRGLAVSTFNIFENFVEQRVAELVVRINSGHLGYRDLPAKLQVRILKTTLKVAGARAGHITTDELLDLSRSVGASFGSLDGVISFSPLAWNWTGSNLGHEDLIDVLAGFHVKNAFNQMRLVSGRVGFPVNDKDGKPLDLRDELRELASERHAAAHNSRHNVSATVINVNVALALKLAFSVDALISRASFELRAGTHEYLADASWTTSERLALREIRQRSRDYAEFREGVSRAVAVSTSQEEAIKKAIARCKRDEILVALDHRGALVEWCFPAID